MSGTKRIESGSPSEQRKSQRIRKAKDFGPDFISYQAQLFLVEENRQVALNKISIVFNTEDDPKTFEEAMASKDSAFWKEALNDEMDSILSNNTWILMDLPMVQNQLVVNEYLEENILLMDQYKPLKQG